LDALEALWFPVAGKVEREPCSCDSCSPDASIEFLWFWAPEHTTCCFLHGNSCFRDVDRLGWPYYLLFHP
jgi:hypothetical protein